MYQKNILGALANDGNFSRLFPYLAKKQQAVQPEPVEQPVQPDISPTPATPPPYAQPVGRPMMPMPEQPMVPDESTVTFDENSAINAPGWDRSTLEVPTMNPRDSKGRMPKPTMPENLSELQQAEWTAQYGEDQDQGWKGRLRELASNFLYGMSQAGPDADWKAALALGGIGAAGGAVKRNWNDRRDAMGKIPYLRDKEQYESQMADARVKRENTMADNARQMDDLERKREADANKAAYYKGLIEDKGRGRDLQSHQIEDLREYRKFLIGNGVRNTDARIRQIEAKLEDADLDRASRETIAVDNRDSREKLAEMKERGISDRYATGQSNSIKKIQIKSADDARKTLAAVEKLAPKGSTPEQIEAKRQQFLKTLSPEVRQALGQ